MAHYGNAKAQHSTPAQHGYVNVISSDGTKFNIKAKKLATGSPVFGAWVQRLSGQKDPSMKLDNPTIERAEVVTAALAIIDREKAIADIPYQCQIDVIKFFTVYKFIDEIRFIKSSIHIAISKSHANFHPFTVFRLAIYLDDIELCGRILAEMGGYRLAPNQWGPENFGQQMPGAGLFLAGAMSFEDMQSLPPAVYWALARAEMGCHNNPKAFSMEFMRLMKLRGAPSLG